MYDILQTNFQPLSGSISKKLKREEEKAVESMIMNQDVIVVLLTAYGKS